MRHSFHLATALALALAGGTAGATKVIDVDANEFAFDPQRIVVEKGEEVRIRVHNHGVLSHNLTIESLGVKTGTVQTDETGNVTFTPRETGEIRVTCSVPGHQEAGMTATLVVRES